LTATLTATEKLGNDLYTFRISSAKLHIQGFEKDIYKLLRKKGILFFGSDKNIFCEHQLSYIKLS